VAFLLFRALKRAEGSRPFSVADLVGHQGSVSVAIPAGRLGTVYVRAEGQNHEISATAQEDITSGTAIKVVGTAGMGLVVERLTPQPVAMPAPPRPAEPAPAPPTAPPTDAPKGDTTDV
jgi:membrane-bound ClpP family serine protease